MVNGKPVLYLDPSIKGERPEQVMRQAMRSDQTYRGRFFGFFRSGMRTVSNTAEAAGQILTRNLHFKAHHVLRLPRNLHFEVHKALYLPRNLHVQVHKVLRLPRNLHVEVHKVLCLPRNLHFEVH